MLKAVAAARNALFHGGGIDVAASLAAMKQVLGLLAGINTHAGDEFKVSAGATVVWPWPEELQRFLAAPVPMAQVRVMLAVTGHRMSVPLSKDQMMVGRDAVVADIAGAVFAAPGARVLVHGIPGIGKDVAATAAVLDARVQNLAGGLPPAWLQASTDGGLRQHLVEHFRTHLPGLLRGAETDQAEALVRIRRWLEDEIDWLFVVEDADWGCRALWDCFPAPSSGAGRLLVTSQAPLHDLASANAAGSAPFGATETFELKPLVTVNSVELWRKMKLFREKTPDDLAGAALLHKEAEWKATAARATAAATRGNDARKVIKKNKQRLSPAETDVLETEKRIAEQDSRNIRATADALQREIDADRTALEADIKARCEAGGAVKYEPPPPNERAPSEANPAGHSNKNERKRQQAMLETLHVEAELNSPALRVFFSDEGVLGNLPLSVALCGQMFRADASLRSVADLIAKVEAVDLSAVDTEGRNPTTDTHYFGLVRTVLFAIGRLEAACGGGDSAAAQQALGLLAAMAMLPAAGVPRSLFTLPEGVGDTAAATDGGGGGRRRGGAKP